MKSLAASLFLFFLTAIAAFPADGAADRDQNWPQWRGPRGTGAAPTANPPTTWSETQNVKWKVKIPGSGTASPVVWGNQVFIQTAVPTGKKAAADESAKAAPASPPQAGAQGQRRGGGGGMRMARPTEPYQFTLLCLDRQTGKTLWQRVVREELPHEGHHPDHGYASHSPVTDGSVVIAYFGSRGLHAFDMQGRPKWSKDFGKMRTKMTFGEGSSPALWGNKVIVTWDHEGDDFIIALDKNTGQELWRTPRDEETSWATPLVVEVGGRAQVITAATRRVRAYDLEDGRLVWESEGLTPNTIPSPVAGNGLVYATAGYRGNKLVAIRLGRTGNLDGTDAVAWSYKKNTPYVPSPLLTGDRLFLFSSNNNILTSFDAKTGKVLVDAERVPNLQGVYASPVAAAGRVYLVGRNGTTVVIKDADKFEVLATNRLEEHFDASPALAGNEIFLRGHAYLYCIAGK